MNKCFQRNKENNYISDTASKLIFFHPIDLFNAFKDEGNRLKECVSKDPQGTLILDEASHLAF